MMGRMWVLKTTVLFLLFIGTLVYGEPQRYKPEIEGFTSLFPFSPVHWRIPTTLKQEGQRQKEGYFYETHFQLENGAVLSGLSLGLMGVAGEMASQALGIFGLSLSAGALTINQVINRASFGENFYNRSPLVGERSAMKHLLQITRGRPQRHRELLWPVFHPLSLQLSADLSGRVEKVQVTLEPAPGFESFLSPGPQQFPLEELVSCGKIYSVIHPNRKRP